MFQGILRERHVLMSILETVSLTLFCIVVNQNYLFQQLRGSTLYDGVHGVQHVLQNLVVTERDYHRHRGVRSQVTVIEGFTSG